jgi:hypothetical protein
MLSQLGTRDHFDVFVLSEWLEHHLAQCGMHHWLKTINVYDNQSKSGHVIPRYQSRTYGSPSDMQLLKPFSPVHLMGARISIDGTDVHSEIGRMIRQSLINAKVRLFEWSVCAESAKTHMNRILTETNGIRIQNQLPERSRDLKLRLETLPDNTTGVQRIDSDTDICEYWRETPHLRHQLDHLTRQQWALLRWSLKISVPIQKASRYLVSHLPWASQDLPNEQECNVHFVCRSCNVLSFCVNTFLKSLHPVAKNTD